jgi:hypothetical protein
VILLVPASLTRSNSTGFATGAARVIKLKGQHILREWTDARERFRLHARKQVFPGLRVTADIGTLYGAARLGRAIRCVSMPDRAVE